MIKKCPVCNSSRFGRKMNSYQCEKCGYIWRPKSSDFSSADELAKP